MWSLGLPIGVCPSLRSTPHDRILEFGYYCVLAKGDMVAKLLPAYLVVGEDELKRNTAVERLKGRLEEGFVAFNLDELTASPDLDPTAVAISLNTVPFGSGFRLVLIHDANKLAKAVSETIVSYLENPNPGCVLCLVASSLAKNTRLYRAVNGVGKQAVIDCTPPKAYKLPDYVMRHARALRIDIDAAAAAELVSRVGDNTTMIDRQLVTLGELCSGRCVRVEDVETYVARTAEVKPWECLDKAVAGDARRALELYRNMKNASEVVLTSLLTRKLREVICARAFIDRGRANGVLEELGRPEWQLRNSMQSARRYTMERLEACLMACAECELGLKSGADPETTFLKLLLFVSA